MNGKPSGDCPWAMKVAQMKWIFWHLKLWGSGEFLLSETKRVYVRKVQQVAVGVSKWEALENSFFRRLWKSTRERSNRAKFPNNRSGIITISAILPLKRAWMGYQPMSFFCNHWKILRSRSLVNRSPSWFSELIFTSSMCRGPMCSRNQWYLIA